jgi:hypothetical protein
MILVRLQRDKRTRGNVDMTVLFDHMKMWYYYLWSIKSCVIFDFGRNIRPRKSKNPKSRILTKTIYMMPSFSFLLKVIKRSESENELNR